MKLSKRESKSNWIEFEGVKLLIDYPTMEQEQRLQEIFFDSSINENVKQIRYSRLYIKFTVKDWEGLEDKCKLKGNELEDELWWSLVSDVMQSSLLFSAIEKELKVLEVDKKKL